MIKYSDAEKIISDFKDKKFSYKKGNNCLTMTLAVVSAAYGIEFEKVETIGFSNMRKSIRKYGKNYLSMLTGFFKKYGFVISEEPGGYCPVYIEIPDQKKITKILGVYLWSGILIYHIDGVQIIPHNSVKVLTFWKREE